jgi:hypothetical protein
MLLPLTVLWDRPGIENGSVFTGSFAFIRVYQRFQLDRCSSGSGKKADTIARLTLEG